MSNRTKKFLWINHRYLPYVPLGVLLLIPVFLYSSYFNIPISREHIRWSEFGSYIGGIYGALGFFAIALSIIFTQRQFKRQNESEIFFQSIAGLSNLLAGRAMPQIKNERESSLAVDFLTTFNKSLGEHSSRRARKIICQYPDLLDNNCRDRLLSVIENHVSKDITRDDLLSIFKCAQLNECWERLKYYFGNPDERSRCNDVLADIGNVLFYKIPLETRLACYRNSWEEYAIENGILIDRFFNMLEFLLSHVDRSLDRDLFLKFLRAQFCAHDYILIFYGALVLNEINPDLVKLISKARLLDNVQQQEFLALIYDCPSKRELKPELEYLCP